MSGHTMHARALRLISASFITAIVAAMSWAPASAQDEKGAMDEKALTILKGMSDYLGGSKTISFRAKTFFDVVLEFRHQDQDRPCE